MNKKIIILLTLIFSHINAIFAVELVLTNDISDILKSQKICIRLPLNNNEQAIHSNSLNFSIDCPYLEIESWNCNKNASIQYVQNFKRTKKLYTDSPSFELFLKIDLENKNTILKYLSNSNVYVSCIVLDKNGTSHAINLVKNLDDSFSFIDTLTFNNKINYGSIQTLTSNFLKNKILYKNFNNPDKPNPDNENLILDNLKDTWVKLVTHLKKLLSLLNNLFCYFFIFILTILLILLRLQNQKIWLIELSRFVTITCLLWSYSFLSYIIQTHIFFIGFAIFLTPISFYYIFTAKTNTIIDKLKSFIGCALATSILPILIKAYISFKFN